MNDKIPDEILHALNNAVMGGLQVKSKEEAQVLIAGLQDYAFAHGENQFDKRDGMVHNAACTMLMALHKYYKEYYKL